MLNVRVLILIPFIYSIYIRCVKKIPVSIVEYCLILSSWFEWRKFEATEWTFNLLLITFLINLPNVLRRTMGQNIFELLYKDLLGFGIMIDIDFLKWDVQQLNNALEIAYYFLKMVSRNMIIIEFLQPILKKHQVLNSNLDSCLYIK